MRPTAQRILMSYPPVKVTVRQPQRQPVAPAVEARRVDPPYAYAGR